ncbi:MAG: DNRLRE domain-containing protein [bacterium]|nr:DNRLRE domain-containing protein [bacterium]
MIILVFTYRNERKKSILTCLILVLTIPSFADVVTLEPAKDACVCDCQPGATNPIGPGYLGQGEYNAGTACYNRLFIQFDFSGLDPDETINSAELRFYCVSFYGTVSGDMLYSRLIEDWNEDTVNFINQPDYTTDGQVETGWPGSGSWHSVDVTGLVTDWYDGTEVNYGLIGHSQGTTGMCDCLFTSSRYSGTTYDPRLVIDYTGSGSDVEGESLGAIKGVFK